MKWLKGKPDTYGWYWWSLKPEDADLAVPVSVQSRTSYGGGANGETVIEAKSKEFRVYGANEDTRRAADEWVDVKLIQGIWAGPIEMPSRRYEVEDEVVEG